MGYRPGEISFQEHFQNHRRATKRWRQARQLPAGGSAGARTSVPAEVTPARALHSHPVQDDSAFSRLPFLSPKHPESQEVQFAFYNPLFFPDGMDGPWLGGPSNLQLPPRRKLIQRTDNERIFKKQWHLPMSLLWQINHRRQKGTACLSRS